MQREYDFDGFVGHDHVLALPEQIPVGPVHIRLQFLEAPKTGQVDSRDWQTFFSDLDRIAPLPPDVDIPSDLAENHDFYLTQEIMRQYDEYIR